VSFPKPAVEQIKTATLSLNRGFSQSKIGRARQRSLFIHNSLDGNLSQKIPELPLVAKSLQKQIGLPQRQNFGGDPGLGFF